MAANGWLFGLNILVLAGLANSVGLYFLMPVVKRELKHYWHGIQSGRIATTC